LGGRGLPDSLFHMTMYCEDYMLSTTFSQQSLDSYSLRQRLHRR